MLRASRYFLFLIWVLFPKITFAHGFGQRIDLPVPLYLYLFGGGLVVVVSFLMLGFLSKNFVEKITNYPSKKISDIFLVKYLESSYFLDPLKFAFVVLLCASLYGGFYGDQFSAVNILPTMVWILFAIGVTFTSALIGNIWKVINPLKTIYEYGEWVGSKLKISIQKESLPALPGVWVAFSLFFIFRWIENISGIADHASVLTLLVVYYMFLTFIGMFFFGKQEWLERADPFNIFFTILSRFSITEVKNNQLYVRPPAIGLLAQKPITSEVSFILLMLSTVAADGILTTPLFNSLYTILIATVGLSYEVAGTLALILLFILFATIYYFFSFLTKKISKDTSSTYVVAMRYIYSLLPIAIAYEIAHYVSILVVDGQRVVYLISDPFNKGWDILGTASYKISYSVLNLKMLWNFQVFLIVIGHVIAILVSHSIALQYFKDEKKALISQYPMLILMILYSVLSLWIMAQPIVAVE